MQEKTKVLFVIEMLFVIAVVVIAFGVFIEEGNKISLGKITEQNGKTKISSVQTSKPETEKISLEKNSDNVLELKQN